MLHDYTDEKRAAWAALGERLAALIALRDNVCLFLVGNLLYFPVLLNHISIDKY